MLCWESTAVPTASTTSIDTTSSGEDRNSQTSFSIDLLQSFRWACGPCRLRRSWTLMSEEDRTEYIDTLLYVQSGTDASLTAEYQALIQMHEDEFGNGPHWQTQFLPWHRWYILEFENILRKYTPCITVPFWAWELDAGSSYIWSNTCNHNNDSFFKKISLEPKRCQRPIFFSMKWLINLPLEHSLE